MWPTGHNVGDKDGEQVEKNRKEEELGIGKRDCEQEVQRTK